MFKIESSQLKTAEKLVILNDRAVGMLTRIYNIKKACADPKSKPAFLGDKHLETAIKHIARKFPVVDARMNVSTFHHVDTMKDDIIKSLGLYYYTFADLMDLKDNILQLLTTMDACQCQLDISLNYELTAGYLNLVVNLICLMILLSRVDDRKVVLGLFNAAYDLAHGESESSFPRLGQMILDYDHPLRKLSEDLGPLNRLMSSALCSLSSVYLRRNITANTWRNAQILSLTANPQQILYAAQTDTIACEYLSLDVMDRWIVLCTIVCHSSLLNDKNVFHLWQMSLQMGICLRLFRDEIFHTHHEVQQFFDSIKGFHKRSQEVKDWYSVALQQSASIHADRRRFLRAALRELCLFMKDQPGLLGPKILFVWMALSFTRDEVLWLLRHLSEWPSSNKKASKQCDELVDRQLPELLYYMLELRELVIKYSDVIQRYYLKYVSGYDAIMTRELVSMINDLNEDEAVILSDFASSISSINSDTDLRALRLDWFRFQARTSMMRSTFSLSKNRKLAIVMNTNVFHLKMIDLQEEMLKETSDLSVYCFYIKILERQWKSCLTLPSQSRFTLCFARICGHFSAALHDMCPEEKSHILEKSLAICNTILDDVCQSVINVMNALCERELALAEQTSPSTIAAEIVSQILRTKGGKNAAVVSGVQKEPTQAGEESYRTDRQVLTYADKLLTTLIELCSGIGQYRQLLVSDHFFAPREYLSQHIEHRFIDIIFAMATEPGSSIPRRPSELLMIIQSYMSVLQNIDALVPLDVTRLFNNVLLQQTQPLDSRSKETMTYMYTKWYLEVVLRRASAGHMLWSEHLQAMVSNGEFNDFAPEQYTDPRELRCLSQIIGPYGVKYLAERLTWHVASQIGELNKVVVANKEVLHIARTQFDCNERMKEVMQALSHDSKDKKGTWSSSADAILQRTAIIGQIFSFRDALHMALEQVLLQRLPFLMSSFTNLYCSMDDTGRAALGELGAAMGIQGPIDIALSNAVRAQSQQMNPDEHYQLSCLLLVAIAISLPKLAFMESATYKPSLRASLNNMHCIPLAVNTVAGALFHYHARGDIHLRMKEFLALASSSVLRIAQEQDGRQDAVSNQSALYVMLEQILKMKTSNVKSWLLDANKLQYDVECDWLLPEERDLRISEGRCPPVKSTTETSSTSTKQSFLPPWLRQRVKEKEKKPMFSIRTKQTLMNAFSLGGAKMVQIDVDDSHASHDLISGVSLSLTCNQKNFVAPANASEPSVQWYVNSQLAGNRKLDWRVTISTEGVLNIWPLLEDDGGNYECSVDGSVMGTTVINVVSKTDAVMNGLLNYMFGAAFYIPITIYVVILVGRDLLKPPVKSKREDKMTAFLEQHMLKNGLEVKENIAKVVYGDKFEERKEEIAKSLSVGVGKSGEKLRGNHDTIKTLLCGIKSREPVAMRSSTMSKNVLKV